MRFFVGLHQPSDAHRLADRAVMISVHRLSGKKGRKAPFVVGDWMMDSGAFSTIFAHGGFPNSPQEYAAHIRRWSTTGNLLCAVSQDYMCEPHMVQRTGLNVYAHQVLTVGRYIELQQCDTAGVPILPVLQGYDPQDYVQHVRMYGDLLQPGAWVGVGSVCKRNGDPAAILAVLSAIKAERPDLRLHGFGLKKTALSSPAILAMLHSADSMAWSLHARKNGRNSNDWREARNMSLQFSILTTPSI